jgi:anti-sigma-K factor RskA
MISDDDLLLYYYRELDAAERARIGAALAEQPELARRLHGLVARLDAAAAMPEVPVPPQTQQRWQVALDRAAREPRAATSRGSFSQPRWQAFAAAAAVAVIAVVFGIQKTMTPLPVTPETTAAETDSSSYENGLKRHLASTEQRLASLDDATPEERARLVEVIISQNRIYALAAERAGEPQLARVLRAFTPVLESVADGRAQTAGSVAQLNFELRVMQARLGAAAATTNTL